MKRHSSAIPRILYSFRLDIPGRTDASTACFCFTCSQIVTDNDGQDACPFFPPSFFCFNSFITPRESLRTLAREIIGAENLLEIYVECSFETCRARDVKGLYKKVDAGQVTNFTGKEQAFEPPAHPHLVLNTESTPLEISLESLHSFVLGQIRPN